MYTYVDYYCTVDIMGLVKYTAVTPHWDTQTNVQFVFYTMVHAGDAGDETNGE